MPAVPKGIDRLTGMVKHEKSGSAPSTKSLTEGLGLLSRFGLDAIWHSDAAICRGRNPADQ